MIDYFTGSGNVLNFEFFGLNNPTGTLADAQGGLVFKLHKIACTQIDTAYTCKAKGLGFSYVRPQSVNGNLGGIPYSGPDGVLGTSDDYYETAWIQYNTITGANIDTIQGGPGAGASDTIVGLFAGSYRVVVIDSLGCSEFVRYLEVIEPIDTFKTVLDTVMLVLCKYDNTGVIQVLNFGGFDSLATNGTTIVPIASRTSRYAVLLKEDSTQNFTFTSCDDPNYTPDYTDTIATVSGLLDTVVFEALYAGRYVIHVYDSLPDATYGQYNPLTGEKLTTSFNYLMCYQSIYADIEEPCFPLTIQSMLGIDEDCWGDSSAIGVVSPYGGANNLDYSLYTYPMG